MRYMVMSDDLLRRFIAAADNQAALVSKQVTRYASLRVKDAAINARDISGIVARLVAFAQNTSAASAELVSLAEANEAMRLLPVDSLNAHICAVATAQINTMASYEMEETVANLTPLATADEFRAAMDVLNARLTAEDVVDITTAPVQIVQTLTCATTSYAPTCGRITMGATTQQIAHTTPVVAPVVDFAERVDAMFETRDQDGFLRGVSRNAENALKQWANASAEKVCWGGGNVRFFTAVAMGEGDEERAFDRKMDDFAAAIIKRDLLGEVVNDILKEAQAQIDARDGAKNAALHAAKAFFATTPIEESFETWSKRDRWDQ